ncbi:MAG: two-component system OmpR family response regulator [Halieaceae bacterium]|jgi:two-component system OmpR family response regulator
MRILLIEDDQKVGAFIVTSLTAADHEVQHSGDGSQGLELALSDEFDVLIVDRMLPGLDGLSIIKSLRAASVQTPVLILSALSEVDDRVDGLRAGGDDYLSKPFSVDELLARVEALLRRQLSRPEAPVTSLVVGKLTMNLLTQQVYRAEIKMVLQPREYKLLEYLMRNSGTVVTRAMLLEHVWGYHFDPQTNVIDVHISRLRQKLDREFDTPMLATVRGAGYCLNA